MDDEKIRKVLHDSNPYLKSQSSFLAMLAEIVANDSNKTEEGCISVAPIVFWTKLFADYFLHIDNPNHDDMLFYVQKDPRDHSDKCEVKVFRRESNKNPGLGDPAFDWTETVYLNLILQQLKYQLTCAICSKNDKGEVTIHKRVSQEVYASPSRHDMEEKGPSAELSYPNIFFSIDSFDEIWNDLHLSEDEMISVEIVAHDENKEFVSVIFLGSVGYATLFNVYGKKIEGLGTANKIASFMTMGLYKPPSTQVQFLKMKGPNGKGYAEMAVEFYKEDKSRKHDETGDGNSRIVSSKSEPDSLHKSGLQRHYLTAVQPKNTASGAATSTPSSPSGPRKPTSTSLKTQLTYVTLPWHKIILDVLKTYECPTESKKPVLGS